MPKGQRYLTVVVDHDSGRLVWAAAGRDRKTVEAFLDAAKDGDGRVTTALNRMLRLPGGHVAGHQIDLFAALFTESR